ncbi:MAG: hypothetical protein Q4D93_03135 [Porphyromonas sp.]|nr:hypothetical protein [Porphyromonas sp.]
MKKIMFNDSYNLTEAVLQGKKTITRRLVNPQPPYGEKTEIIMRSSRYKIDEIVAVAQSYASIIESGSEEYSERVTKYMDTYGWGAGLDNKMFVKADLMPHKIKITNIHAQLLQDISDEDCLKEGVMKANNYFRLATKEEYYFRTARSAFRWLIDKTCGEGTWTSNPYVFVYEFELIKYD